MAIDRKFLDANHADLVAQIRAEGQAEGGTHGRAEGATAERERIQAVYAQSMPGHDALIKSLAFDGKTTGAEAAVQVLAAERARLGAKAGAIAADAGALGAAAPSPSADPGAAAEDQARADAGKPVEERCKAKWDADPKVRGEFGTLEAYTAFTKADEAGRVRVLGAKKAA
jgi:hypothetical protein